MKTTLLYTIPAIVIIAIAMSLTYCNSPAETDEKAKTTDVVITDTINKAISVNKNTIVTEPENKSIDVRKPLTLIIKNLASATAPVIVGLYNSKKNFLKVEGRLKEYKFIPTGTILTALITDLSYGEFAMAIYQDENSSGAIDKNMIGVPTEGYAFSNNYKPRIKAPAFSDCMFVYDSSTNTVTMNMIR